MPRTSIRRRLNARRQNNLRQNVNRTRPCFVQLDRLLADIVFYGRRYNFTINELRILNGVRIIAENNMGVGPQVVKVNGVVHHIMPQITPRLDAPAKFGQLYYLDQEDCNTVRESHSSQCRPNILRLLDNLLRQINPFPAQYRQLRVIHDEQVNIARQNNIDVPEVILAIAPNIQDRIVQAGLDPNRYNVPTCNEIAAIFVGDEPPFPVDIKLYPLRGDPQMVRDVSPLLDPLSYPLLFPHGDLGWNIELRHTGPNATARYNKVTCREFASYRIAIRNHFSLLHFSRKLFQQWLVDSWCRIEGLQLYYIRTHQRQIHLDNYNNLLGYIQRQAHQRHERIGKIFVLPPTFIGSPRYMEQRYMDAMAIVGTYGKPDLFITLTCNPTWPEIVNNLEPGQETIHRPDLVCRIFHIKLQHLISLIIDQCYFGTVKSLLYSVEFQKRGLPHAHILIILQGGDKITTAEQVDEFIRAEIPDPDEEPTLYQLVKKHVIHKKCGAGRPGVTCLRNNVCRWHFPKDFRDTTQLLGDTTYAKYRRRDNGRTCILGDTIYDNRDVVPYCPALLLIFQTHINVEICASITATKYLYKYIHKGHDGIVVNIQQGTRSNAGVFNWDEIDNYQECRYVSSHEACWRILGFELSFSNISVFLLQLHLPSMQNILFHPDHIQQALDTAKDSHLLAYFKLNQIDVDARQHLYVDIVKHYTWQRTAHVWTRRKSHFNVIGRLPDIPPNSGDLFYLRVLLNYVRGATSFEDLKRVHGLVHATFRDACLARQLIQNDFEYDRCMEEASSRQLPCRLRQLFANIILWCDPENPLRLWDRFCSFMCQDFMSNFNLNLDEAKNVALDEISKIFIDHNKTLVYFGLPTPDIVVLENIRQRMILNNIDNLTEEHHRIGLEMRDSLNVPQRNAFDYIIRLVWRYTNGDRSCKLVFVDGPAGTGKTFFYNSLLHTVKGAGHKTIAVAFTGIAAILLLDGVTSHTQFGIPIPCVSSSRSNLKFNDHRVEQLENANLIVWDEASMTCKFSLECVDMLLRDIMKTPDVPFGGKVLVMGGDFRQLLPVKRGGRKQDVLNICIKSSVLFSKFIIFHFTENMRADPIERDFANQLLLIGNGQHERVADLPEEYLKISSDFLIPANELIFEIFENDPLKYVNENRAILTPTNEDAFRFNEKILKLLLFPEKQYISVDKILNHNQATFYVPLDVVHKQTPMGCPQHVLILKENAIIMLMRNINVAEGLCNGTRLKIVSMEDHLLVTEILMGPKSGNIAFIPRMCFTCERKDTGLPFEFSRIQFPVRLAYAMTINKSQGQTLDKTGIFLTIPVFAHGQLYVAMSRSRRPTDIKISILERINQGRLNRDDGTFTKNIVFKEVL